MKNISTNTDGFISVSDLRGNHRYRYCVLKHRFVPTVTILCERKTYEVSIHIPLTTDEDGYDVADIKHPEFFIIEFEHQPTESKRIFHIKVSDTDVEKKIAEFTGSLIISENIMDLIDRFFLGSNKTIYR